MACAEQPLKKRKLYEPIADSQLLETLGQPETSVSSPQTPPPLSQEEVIAKRRNRDEIRSVYECYKQLKACAAQKDARHVPELEQAYLALITASRGCTSVQRIVADFIPCYARYCPTALEAAAQVLINMHNWSLALLTRGEDRDGVAFQTAKACIFGLPDICSAASLEAPTSSVIRGICSAVFQNVLSFFISSFEGNDIFPIIDKNIWNLQDSDEIFFKLNQEISDEDDCPSLNKLSRFRALCILRIFFSCPKNVLAACFEFFHSATEDFVQKGLYLTSQITRQVDEADAVHILDKRINEPKSCTFSLETSPIGNKTCNEKQDDNNVAREKIPVLKSCLLGLALDKNPSLRSWMFSKYKKLKNFPCSNNVSEILSSLEQFFELFGKQMISDDNQCDSDEDDSCSSKYINQQHLVTRTSNQHESSADVSGKHSTLGFHNGSYDDNFADQFSGSYLKSGNCNEIDAHSNTGCSHDSACARSMDFETSDHGDFFRGRSSVPRDFSSNQTPSPAPRTPLEFRSNSFEGRNSFTQVDKNQNSNRDYNFPALRSTANNGAASPSHHSSAPYNPRSSQMVWYFDGDSATMDIFSASKQLWLGSLGPEASDAHIRFQLERFGQIERFSYFPIKGFAMVEYRNIMDAINAREYLRAQFHWRIKFMDVGLGTRGAINGTAVGCCSHVYVGNVRSQWVRDEILFESRKAVYRGPCMVTDLSREGAFLMEYETPDEAAAVIVHLRLFRKEKSNHLPLVNVGPSNVSMPCVDGSRSVPSAPVHVDTRSNNLLNISKDIQSPHAQPVLESPSDSGRSTHLASLLSSLRSKYNITQPFGYIDNSMSGNWQATVSKEEDGVSSSTLWVSLPNFSSPFLTDDELMEIFSVAMSNVGSVLRLTRVNGQMGCGWFVECSSIDAAIVAVKTLRACPAIFFQLEFSQSGKNNKDQFSMKHESSSMDFVPPRLQSENPATGIPAGHSFQPNWSLSGHAEMPEVGTRHRDSYDNIFVDHSQGGNPPFVPMAMQGTPHLPQQQVQAVHPPPIVRPVYLPANSSWDARSLNYHMPVNPNSPGIGPNSFRGNAVATPFISASVTPLAQMQDPPVRHFDQVFSHSIVPTLLSSLPPALPPQVPHPPPLPPSQPPVVPPPPNSPPPIPPPPVSESIKEQSMKQSVQYMWQGLLCKSGVNYCTIYARRLASDTCKYSNNTSEPALWPAKLDMTKRTDFRHVKSTFTNTPPHKREVCQFIPSSSGDQKGFQDFIAYLKQRECAGVIKIPAVKSIWARLLFIIPYSQEICSLISIEHNSPDGLIGLILPKETNSEWA